MTSVTARIAAVLLPTALLAACGDFTTQDDYGVFRLEQRYGKRFLCWEGNCTYVKRSRLCPRTGGDCLEDRRIFLDPDIPRPDGSPFRRILVTVTDGDGVPEAPGESRKHYFFDTRTGKRLRCADCGFDLERRLAATEDDEFEWRHDGDTIDDGGHGLPKSGWEPRFRWSAAQDRAIAVLPGLRDGRPEILLLDFAADGIRYRDISSPGLRDGNLGRLSFASDDAGVAWQACAPRCTLWWYTFATGRHASREIHCAYHNDPGFDDWKNGRPVVRRTEPEKCPAETNG